MAFNIPCPKCGSNNVKELKSLEQKITDFFNKSLIIKGGPHRFECQDCGHQWVILVR